MNMKRLTFLILLIMLVGVTTWAGVRLDMGSSNVGGTSMLFDVAETSIVGQTGSKISTVFLGEASTEVQTPSLTAALTVSHDSAFTLETVTFDASGSLPGDGVITLYEWDLDGDGVFDESSSEETWVHAYTDDGVVFVQSRVTNDLGESAVSEVLQLDIVNQLPTARFVVNLGDGVEGNLAQFVDSSYDVDGIISSWTWDFGDGTTSNEANPTHIYNTGGLFSVALFVIDDDGAISDTYVFEIEVFNSGPVAEFTVQQSTLNVEQPLILIDTSFDQSVDGEIIHIAWDFGDGVYQAGGPSSDNTYSHIFTVSGSYRITLYVIDNGGAMASTQITVEVL
jgi:PKD repeat protein